MLQRLQHFAAGIDGHAVRQDFPLRFQILQHLIVAIFAVQVIERRVMDQDRVQIVRLQPHQAAFD
ncbi:hypothetical protein D3C76_1711390 [compost metagenome]